MTKGSAVHTATAEGMLDFFIHYAVKGFKTASLLHNICDIITENKSPIARRKEIQGSSLPIL
jgi:hypothetical protein